MPLPSLTKTRRTLSVPLNGEKVVAKAVVEVAVQRLAAECNPAEEVAEHAPVEECNMAEAVADLALAEECSLVEVVAVDPLAEAFEAVEESTPRQGQGHVILAVAFKCRGAVQ